MPVLRLMCEELVLVSAPCGTHLQVACSATRRMGPSFYAQVAQAHRHHARHAARPFCRSPSQITSTLRVISLMQMGCSIKS